MSDFININGHSTLFADLCRIELPTAGAKSSLLNAPQVGAKSIVHDDVRCQISENGGKETYSVAGSEVISTHDIILQGYYPQITEAMNVVDKSNGQSYNILLASNDPMKVVSILKARKVKRT